MYMHWHTYIYTQYTPTYTYTCTYTYWCRCTSTIHIHMHCETRKHIAVNEWSDIRSPLGILKLHFGDWVLWSVRTVPSESCTKASRRPQDLKLKAWSCQESGYTSKQNYKKQKVNEVLPNRSSTSMTWFLGFLWLSRRNIHTTDHKCWDPTMNAEQLVFHLADLAASPFQMSQKHIVNDRHDDRMLHHDRCAIEVQQRRHALFGTLLQAPSQRFWRSHR